MKFVRAITPYAIIVILLLVCTVLVVLFIDASTKRPLTTLESALFQVVILGTGVTASYFISQRSTKVAAEQLIKTSCAPLLFDVCTILYSSLFYMKRIIRYHKESRAKPPDQIIEIVEVIIDQQVNTVVDSMDDWRDIIPEDVADIEQRLREHDTTETETETLKR